MYSEIWSWEKCKSKIRTLKGRLGFQETPVLRFLALSLSLEDGRIYDNLRQSFSPQIEPSAYCILSGYADARPMPESTRLVSFAQLSGGRSYQNAFIQRVVKPTENFFASKTSRLYHAAKLLGGERLGFGDYSVRIYSLPLVPITIVLWVKTPEFPVSASILFSSSANYCLSTEQLAMLGELTSARLRYACEVPIARG
ncbi:MAG: DUF3786 domain-containing protein [Candidatus Bathyarchaeota archaeon]|nr:MAG: DUF3786 domain-containing protein [Candidatus Bathyarchaeota archaeon]